MEDKEELTLAQTRRRLVAADADLSRSTFTDVNLAAATFENVSLSEAGVRNANLSGIRIRDADLRNASIADCMTEGMTVDGIAVSEMMAAYRAAHPETT